MNKTEFIKEVAEKTNATEKDTAKFLETFIEVIQLELARGEKVQIIGFGSFEGRQRNEREAFNPATREKITVAATVTPVFKAGKSFKEFVAASVKD
jgi:DNA-binding protein HU-beta